ncbi:hypothetical protein C8A01DRAFT_50142 [Parachaetomium inaequale]|uniref:Uncharacterized protein n=1 Tax=Parachaetomium inaequale TaxID=2588326 RepID=A0AAN6P7N0_9PEZI|nr:hypothetical protein C8A01DRAFT_50142 [Parachaetomium inaequale]
MNTSTNQQIGGGETVDAIDNASVSPTSSSPVEEPGNPQSQGSPEDDGSPKNHGNSPDHHGSLQSQGSSEGHGSPETQAEVPQIVVQPASDCGDGSEVSPAAQPPTRRAPPPALSDRAFLEVPTPSRPPNRRAVPRQGSSSQPGSGFGPKHIPLSLTEPVEPRQIPLSLTGPVGPPVGSYIDPLRMHPPTGLASSSTMPLTTATGRPVGLRYDGNPYTPQGRAVMAKVEKMLAASAALKPDPAATTTTTTTNNSKPSRLGFLKKLTSPTTNLAARLFPNHNKKPKPKPHEIRHITGTLDPLPLPALTTAHVPSVHLRLNERGNLAREKALRVLGDTPRFSTLGGGGGGEAASSLEDPFASSAGRLRPTAFEARLLRAVGSEGCLSLSRGGGGGGGSRGEGEGEEGNPFRSARVMAGGHDSLLPESPGSSSTPPPSSSLLRAPPLPPTLPRAFAFAGGREEEQGVVSPTRVPRTTTTTTTTTTAAAAGAVVVAPAAPRSTPTLRQSRSFSDLDAGFGRRLDGGRVRPCADRSGPDGRMGGSSRGGGGGVGTVAVLRFGLSSSRPLGGVWGQDDEGDGEEEGEEEEEEEVFVGRTKRHPAPDRADLAALERQLRARFPALAVAGPEGEGEEEGGGAAAAGPVVAGEGTFGGSVFAAGEEEGEGGALGVRGEGGEEEEGEGGLQPPPGFF